MTACIGAHFGLPVLDMIGTKKPEEHETLAAAMWMGTKFMSFNPGYAATLNAKARAFSQSSGRSSDGWYFHLETNITVDQEKNSAERVEAFHKVGSVQVQNIPDHIETIIVPAGSCNSVTSVLYGIAQYRPKSLKRIILMGIGSYGSSDPAYIYRRLQVIGSTLPLGDRFLTEHFRWNFDNRVVSRLDAPYDIIHYNVNQGCGSCDKCKNGYCSYNDLKPFTYQDLEFHPRYEGKMMHYAQDHIGEFRQYFNERSLFWIVGSKPEAKVMEPYLKSRFGTL
jgi:hypothetical protein